MLVLEEIIEGCKTDNKSAQKALYTMFSKKIMGICVRYNSCKADADDLFQESFIKIFNNIKHFEGKGSFEGWARKIVVNTAFKGFKKKNPHFSLSDPNSMQLPVFADYNVIDSMSSEELVNMVNSLPEGYRMVFNLFVIEGYSHKEISEMLNISPGTSKSQFFNAKKVLKNMLINKKMVSSEQDLNAA